jgi:hypothetical protein
MSETKTRYPRCSAVLESLVASSSSPSLPPTAFRVGPGVLRPPPAVARQTPSPSSPPASASSAGETPTTSALLGELVDMVLVGADEARSGRPEVHLQFKSDVCGGLHMRLEKADDGLHASFVVKDAATRREVADHVDGIVEHLRARGFAVTSARLEIRPPA